MQRPDRLLAWARRSPRCGAIDHVLAFGQFDHGAERAGQGLGAFGDEVHDAGEIQPQPRDVGLGTDNVEQALGRRLDAPFTRRLPPGPGWRQRARCRRLLGSRMV